MQIFHVRNNLWLHFVVTHLAPTSVPMSQPYNDQIGAGSSKFYYLTSGVNLNNNQVFQIFLYNLSQSAPLTLYVNPSR